MDKNKALIVTFVILVAVLAGLGWWSSNNKDASSNPPNTGEVKSVKISGKLACLPPKGGREIYLDCAIGLQANSGEFYLLPDLKQEDLVSGKFYTGQQVEISGRLSQAVQSEFDVAGSIEINNIVGETDSVIQPVDPNSGTFRIQDNPLSVVPASAISVEYLIEHRSALNGKTVKVKCVVVVDWTDASRCSPYAEMLCPQPIIYIADSALDSRPTYYDLRVVLSEGDTSYKIGQSVEIKGTVEGSTES